MSMTTRSRNKRKQDITSAVNKQEDKEARVRKSTIINRIRSTNEGRTQPSKYKKQNVPIQEEKSAELDQQQSQEDNYIAIAAEEEEPSADHEYFARDEPLFDGSRIGAQRFCTELLSIARTFEMSKRACNDVLNLVRKLAPPGGMNNCPEHIDTDNMQLAMDSQTADFEITAQQNEIILHEKEQRKKPGSTIKRKDMDPMKSEDDPTFWEQSVETDSEYVVVVDDFGSQQQLPPSHAQHHQGSPEELAKVIGSLNKLSKDVNSLKRQYATSSSAMATDSSEAGKNEQKRVSQRTTKQEMDRRRPKFFVKIFDMSNKIRPICDFEKDELIQTVQISREDESTRIIYEDTDITDRVLDKLDISLFLHNPSYCGRAVADTLFNPEFLSRYHILAEGQNNSRSNRELMPPELSKVFYDSLRKLGVSRIVEDDQLGWMEQARDAVNQRNRDIKIPGCRRKFFQNSDPIFK